MSKAKSKRIKSKAESPVYTTLSSGRVVAFSPSAFLRALPANDARKSTTVRRK